MHRLAVSLLPALDGSQPFLVLEAAVGLGGGPSTSAARSPRAATLVEAAVQPLHKQNNIWSPFPRYARDTYSLRRTHRGTPLLLGFFFSHFLQLCYNYKPYPCLLKSPENSHWSSSFEGFFFHSQFRFELTLQIFYCVNFIISPLMQLSN